MEYESRKRLYNEFRDRMLKEPQVSLTTVCLTNKGFQSIAKWKTPNKWNIPMEYHIQLGTDSVLFFKENLLNIGFDNLPDDARFVAWVDADVMSTNPHWVRDTIEALKEN